LCRRCLKGQEAEESTGRQKRNQAEASTQPRLHFTILQARHTCVKVTPQGTFLELLVPQVAWLLQSEARMPPVVVSVQVQ